MANRHYLRVASVDYGKPLLFKSCFRRLANRYYLRVTSVDYGKPLLFKSLFRRQARSCVCVGSDEKDVEWSVLWYLMSSDVGWHIRDKQWNVAVYLFMYLEGFHWALGSVYISLPTLGPTLRVSALNSSSQSETERGPQRLHSLCDVF